MRLFFLFSILFFLAACSSENEAAAPVETGARAEEGFYFAYKNEKVYMDGDITDALARIGEPRSVYEEPSCAFDGIDKIFRYPGFDIYTYPEKEKDFIHQIYFRDDSVSTAEGIFIGGSYEEMVSAYGSGYEREQSQYAYADGRTRLQFILSDGGIIEAITYRLIME